MSNQYNIAAAPLWLNLVIFVPLLTLLFVQGIWLFRDAQKRGRFPWLWGLWGLIHFPEPIIVYYFLVIRKSRKKDSVK